MVVGFGFDPIPGLTQLKPEVTYLLVLNGPKANQYFSLNRLRSLIGRSHPPHIIVDIDLSGYEPSLPTTISRHHAVIQWANNKLQIIDLASRNGTFVNGQQLTPPSADRPSDPVVLTVGSKIKLGNLEFAIVVAG
ncbi:FHA domain-containing protein [Planktothrix sp. FACHB-1355]|uniref:FHA domain-containing protein n=2 Tax=Cyanophyceae TaxID=3028117 RepID=A0A926VDN9_9CYAN|nr:FHA domain-containing protein [Aerosakkonema funiforme FACHB-1375]MBD3560965.1 FHA domain-containing protein [Planktothrix sp. FACHB-1355]